MPMAKAWRASRQYVHLKPVDQKENCDWRKSEQEVPSLDRSRDRLRVRDDKREKRDEPQDIHRPRRSERLARALPQFFRRPVMATEHHAQRADEKRAHHGPAHHDFPRQGERRREKPDERLREETERDANDGVESGLLRRSVRGIAMRVAQDQHAERHRDNDQRSQRNGCGGKRDRYATLVWPTATVSRPARRARRC